MRRLRNLALLLLVCATVVAAALAQFRGSRNRETDSRPLAVWEVPEDFRKDVFTFVRIQYSDYSGSYNRYGVGSWWVDHPAAEYNLVYRLQQLTSIKVHPEGRILKLTDKELFDYPFIYIVEPGGLLFKEEEVKALRRYLLSGGFLMVDDFWGEQQWQNFYEQIKRVFPEREPEELSMDHPIFHCVFPLKLEKNQMQIPNARTGTRSEYPPHITWEYHDGEECRDVHFKGLFDDKRRMMAFIAHNTDNGDGWEREGENPYFFREFSEKKAYPLGINVIFYAMTH